MVCQATGNTMGAHSTITNLESDNYRRFINNFFKTHGCVRGETALSQVRIVYCRYNDGIEEETLQSECLFP
jgi:hypothetical protein